MQVPPALLAAVVIGALGLVGCSSDGGSPATSVASSTGSTSGSSEAEPLEPLATGPSIEPADSPRKMLLPGADDGQLAAKVASGAEHLRSVHIEERIRGPHPLRLSYDVDATRRCSGLIEDSGEVDRFVTTDDGRMYVVPEADPDGPWIEETAYTVKDSCLGGPRDAVFGTVNRAGSHWFLLDSTRVGVERWGGRRVVHFTKRADGQTADTWLMADGDALRLLKLVWSRGEGVVRTFEYSEFDAAGPIAPEPTNIAGRLAS